MAFNISYVFQAVDRFSGINGNIRRSIQSTSNAFRDLTNSANRAGDAFKQSYDKMRKVGDVGRELRNKVTLPVTVAAGVGIKVLADYETALLNIAKTTNMNVDPQLEAFGQRFVDLSTKIPVSANELMAFGSAAAQFGIRGEDSILKFSEVMAKLVRSSDVVGEEGAKIIARLMKVTGESTDSVDRFASTLVQLGNTTEVTESEILYFANRVAAAGSNFGITASQAMGLGASIAAVGVEAESAQGTFTRSFVSMNKAISKGGMELAVFTKLSGMSASQFKESFKNDAVATLLEFSKGLKKFKDAGGDQIAVLDALGLEGVRDVSTLGLMAEHFQSITEKVAEANQAFKDNVALEREFAVFADSISNKGNKMRNEFTKTTKLLAMQWKPEIINVITSLQGFAHWIGELVNQHPKMTKFVTTMMLIAATIGPLMMLLRVVVPLLAATRALGIGFSLTPFGLMLTGIAALTAAMVTYKDEIYEVLVALGLFNQDYKSKFEQGAKVKVGASEFEQTRARLENRMVTQIPTLSGIPIAAQESVNKSVIDLNVNLEGRTDMVKDVRSVVKGSKNTNLGMNMAGGIQ